MILVNEKTHKEYNSSDTVYHPKLKTQVPIEYKKLKVNNIEYHDKFLSVQGIDENAKTYSVMFWKSKCPGHPLNVYSVGPNYTDYNMEYDEVSGNVKIKEMEVGNTYTFLGCEYIQESKGVEYNQFSPDGGFYLEGESLEYNIPVDVQSLTGGILGLFDKISDENIKSACLGAYNKYYSDLVEKPAATKHHHNYIGGLLHHTYEVMVSSFALSNVYNCNKDVVLAASFFHDIMKINEYDISGKVLPYHNKIGHVVGSADTWKMFALASDVKSDIIDSVYHCILSHHRHLDWGSPVQPQTIEACIVHCADNVSAMVNPIAIGFNQITNKDFYLRTLSK